MIALRHERPGEAIAREELLDRAYGCARFGKTSQRLRAGRLPADGLSLVAHENGRLIGTVRLWNVSAGAGRPSLLLGPLAVDPDFRARGIGGRLLRRATNEAAKRGHRSILLIGDEPYYGRFGFSTARTGLLWMPGAFDRKRLLGYEIVGGALHGAHGLIAPTGRLAVPPAAAAHSGEIERHSGRVA